ncbi:hypothetical protein HZC08_01095 [Candidatus Micrarchaeota archaeon]|nr:hypothetical protein [Candidatus Micrarchaeota archaeon]
MTFEEKNMFWDRTTYAMKLVEEKDKESAKFQILGFMPDWFGFFGRAKEYLFSEVVKNPASLLQAKGLLQMLSAAIATEPAMAELKQRNDGLVEVSSQLWKNTDQQQDVTKFEKFVKENKSFLYSYCELYNEAKQMARTNGGSLDIRKMHHIMTKFEAEALPKMKEFASVSPDPGSYILYCVGSGNWDLTGIVDRISLVPFYMNSVYQNVRKRELAAMEKDLPTIEAKLTESSVDRLEDMKTNLDLLVGMEPKDQDAKNLIKKLDATMVKAKIVYDKIIEARRMSAEEYKGKDKAEVVKNFTDLYKKKYPDEKLLRVVVNGASWIEMEDKTAEFREGAPGTIVEIAKTFKYKVLQGEAAIEEDKRYSRMVQVWLRHDRDAAGNLIGKPYLYSATFGKRMLAANVNK